MPFTANTKQLLALIWTMIAIVISLIVVLTLEYPQHFGPEWQTMTILFFAAFLVITLPIYLLIALWHMVTEQPEEE